jgi:hypothetical protein
LEGPKLLQISSRKVQEENNQLMKKPDTIFPVPSNLLLNLVRLDLFYHLLFSFEWYAKELVKGKN